MQSSSAPWECPVCGDGPIRRSGEKNGYVLWECRVCRLLFADPNLLGGEIHSRYQRYYDDASFAMPPPTTVDSLEKLVRSAEPFRRNSRWLDFGYGEGGLLRAAERYGWQCYGVEISQRALEHGRQLGWTVTADPRDDPRFPNGSFDVISLVELLEHVPVPLRVLQDAACWLRPAGLLYITTPNARSLNRRLLGPAWSVVCPPEHVMLWTARALRIALTRAGF